jgi:hypothetical protein
MDIGGDRFELLCDLIHRSKRVVKASGVRRYGQQQERVFNKTHSG